MKGNANTTKFIFLHGKQANGFATPFHFLIFNHKFWIITMLTLFTFISFITLFTSTATYNSQLSSATSSAHSNSLSSLQPLPPAIFEALVNYAVISNSSGKMPGSDIRAISAVLNQRGPCNFLVFGVGPETALWRALNHGGRTVFIDENEYYIANFEGKNPPGLEAYDVAYTTKVRELPALIAASREQRRGECRPVQNLLFSDCRLAINDLPNQLYEVAWDVILVDGPRGYSASAPGRMAAIFTAAVMARSQGDQRTDVFVHDYERNVEKVCSEEFLCRVNLVAKTRHLGHFVIEKGSVGSTEDFCVDRKGRKSSEKKKGSGGVVKVKV